MEPNFYGHYELQYEWYDQKYSAFFNARWCLRFIEHDLGQMNVIKADWFQYSYGGPMGDASSEAEDHFLSMSRAYDSLKSKPSQSGPDLFFMGLFHVKSSKIEFVVSFVRWNEQGVLVVKKTALEFSGVISQNSTRISGSAIDHMSYRNMPSCTFEFFNIYRW
jgi:hypothetical protein